MRVKFMLVATANDRSARPQHLLSIVLPHIMLLLSPDTSDISADEHTA
jgi:hypothetical protein